MSVQTARPGDPSGLLRPGFAEPTLDAQRCFRILLDAMAHPGRIAELPVAIEPPPGLMAASAALCLTLLDAETPFWLDPAAAGAEAAAWLRFHCGCPLAADSRQAAFALVAGTAPDLTRFAEGDDLAPEASATLIWQVERLEESGPLVLTGPGIERKRALGLAPLAEGFLEAWAANGALFPCGLDLVLVCGGRLAALPRTTRIARRETDGED
ncbi:alpha-D-ribose 1-methylphosphonate 5-triphosphate synthase subunit PhnH [Tistlia consotensis]|uniref:Alpha-D-ribose 1-methylphosphonate 5-triphosphate synthase subunit PhnH n=1 Tax=Tistlia consotensis USBA 355 TaxID=560819 RepID=A0A1Y6CV70_9PROT|nr:phosphonate C-P lyase system protein PhnH [Tistlia consotensis]SMF80433.1 alpha-D-ribose 1-methylphosphonate 5-triphosphate synthase subunit PhnH [Tistlia consotensis USBA 355]SNR62695.1 alpha-D-ribose 1-methylphosphonate 5-triphosphate synthase subunit PhnH [Tistlia consotensis]